MRRYIIIPFVLIIAGLLISFRRKIAPASLKEVRNFAASYKIRGCDVHGCGYYGASRTHGIHRGIDIYAREGDPIPAPFDCVVKRHGKTYSYDTRATLIEVEGTGIFKGYTAKMMHVFPAVPVGSAVHKQGKTIAHGEGIEKRFKGITPHYHFELYDPAGNLVNPENFK